MSLYQQRMTSVWAQMKREGLGHVSHNVRLSLASRQGQYLIKKTNKWECRAGIGYLDHSYRANGWGSWSKRSEAAWFTKEEIKEITKGWRGIKIVKR